MNNTLNLDYIFEVSWEVCNKVGGIHTVISTKSLALSERCGDLIFIGPDTYGTNENSEFIEDASYLRLNTATIGYTLPQNWTKKIGVSSLRIYATGNNLFCLTGYSGLDPDVTTSSATGGFPTPGYDLNSYPKARSFTVGANITF